MGITWLAWDDYSGGYWVGERDADQPRNSWSGVNVMVDPNTGYLMPMPPVQESVTYPTDYTNVPPSEDDFSYPVRLADPSSSTRSADLLWAQQDSGTSWRWWCSNATAAGDVSRSAAAITLSFASEWTEAVPAVGALSGTLYAWLNYIGGHMVRATPAGPPTFTDTAAVGASQNRVALWNARMVTWYPYNSNLLYYSDANAFTTWPTGNVYTIGDDQPIVSVIVAPNSLWIGKRSGWWELRGGLGTTATINQVLTAEGPSVEGGHRLSNGLVMYDGSANGVQFDAIRGVRTEVINARQTSRAVDLSTAFSGNHMVRASTSGLYVGYDPLATGDDQYCGWIYDSLRDRWMRYRLPTALRGNGILRWAWDYDGWVDTNNSQYPDPIFGVLSGTSSRNKPVAFASSLNFPTIPADTAATVTLAEHNAPPGSLERAREVWVEVVAPDDASDYNGIEVTVRLQGIGAPDAANSLDPIPFTQPMKWERNGNQLADAARYMIRFQPSDLGACSAFRPEITLTNCKLRRVILAVERIGGTVS